jgi:hypothetical protein
MKKILPETIPAVATLLEALNEKNYPAAIHCFTTKTIVCEAGMDYVGTEQIKDWWHKRIKPESPFKIKDAFEEDGFMVVKVAATENLSGQPVASDFRFTFIGEKISTLDVS